MPIHSIKQSVQLHPSITPGVGLASKEHRVILSYLKHGKAGKGARKDAGQPRRDEYFPAVESKRNTQTRNALIGTKRGSYLNYDKNLEDIKPRSIRLEMSPPP